MRLNYFIIFSTAIFILERIFQTVFVFPIFIFPVFAVLFILHSHDEASDIIRILIASLFFDFFSGFNFGIYSLAIFAVCLTIYFLKTRLNISANSFLSSAILSVAFVFEFFLILSIGAPVKILIRQSGLIAGEAVIWSVFFGVILKKLNSRRLSM